MADWQVIDTAPKDGTRILGRRTRVDLYTGELRYLKRKTFWGKTSHGFYGWNYGRNIESANLWEPTHWQPLTAA